MWDVLYPRPLHQSKHPPSFYPYLHHRSEVSGTQNALLVPAAKAGRTARSGSADTNWGGQC